MQPISCLSELKSQVCRTKVVARAVSVCCGASVSNTHLGASFLKRHPLSLIFTSFSLGCGHLTSGCSILWETLDLLRQMQGQFLKELVAIPGCRCRCFPPTSHHSPKPTQTKPDCSFRRSLFLILVQHLEIIVIGDRLFLSKLFFPALHHIARISCDYIRLLRTVHTREVYIQTCRSFHYFLFF